MYVCIVMDNSSNGLSIFSFGYTINLLLSLFLLLNGFVFSLTCRWCTVICKHPHNMTCMLCYYHITSTFAGTFSMLFQVYVPLKHHVTFKKNFNFFDFCFDNQYWQPAKSKLKMYTYLTYCSQESIDYCWLLFVLSIVIICYLFVTFIDDWFIRGFYFSNVRSDFYFFVSTFTLFTSFFVFFDFTRLTYI